MATLAWYIPVLIFCARICDVSVGTVRMLFVLNGFRAAAAGLGFIEVTVWVLAVSGVLTHLNHPITIVAYAGGFAVGVLVGMTIEDRIAIGYRLVRVINSRPEVGLPGALRDAGFRVTQIDGHGRSVPVEVIFTVIPRRALRTVRSIVHTIAPEAFLTVENTDRPTGGEFAVARLRGPFARFGDVRK